MEVSCSKDLVRLHCDPRTAKMGRKLQWYRDFDKTRDGRPSQELLELKVRGSLAVHSHTCFAAWF